jgi:hypothetical protein
MAMTGFFQNGYITHDLDRAIDCCAPLLGTSDFAVMEVELPLTTAAGDKSMRVRVGTAWRGALQIELIQPLSGHIASYLNVLPTDRADAVPRFHHVAVRRENLEGMRREAAELRLPVVFETGGSGISSIFIDARKQIGHYLEFVCADSQGWAVLGGPRST